MPTTLYHGSNRLFERPDLAAGRDHRDFGRGFYTTTLRAQAEDWSRNVAERFGGQAHLYVLECAAMSDLAVKEFPGICVEWLDMVKDNRVLGGVRHSFDVVIGPVANDNTVRTIALYVAGVYDADEAMRRLRYLEPNNQVSFHTQRAMARLTLRGREDV